MPAQYPASGNGLRSWEGDPLRRFSVRVRRVLLLAVALVVAAALSGGTEAYAATTAGTATAAASSTPCSFNPATSCQSTDATTTVNTHYSDASTCTFTWNVNWADGSSSDVTDTDPADGYTLLARHTYAKAGTYHITATGQVAAGDCTANTGNYYFTLVKPAQVCKTLPIVYYVHGIWQGPTVSHPQLNQSATLNTFNQDLGSMISGTRYTAKPVAYPAADGFNVGVTWDTYMNDGVRNLQSDITQGNNSTCSGDQHIALVGYSMGAWVVDKWLQQHKNEWGEVTAVTLFGDPCWTSSGHNEGLTRLFLLNYGCPPGGDYPYPAAKSSVPFTVKSYTLNKDPVSGDGFHGGQLSLPPNVLANQKAQLASAIACVSARICPHLRYESGQSGAGLVKEGATVVATALGKYVS